VVRIATEEPDVEKLSHKKGRPDFAPFFTSGAVMWLDY
jgi:hypothetical protein